MTMRKKFGLKTTIAVSIVALLGGCTLMTDQAPVEDAVVAATPEISKTDVHPDIWPLGKSGLERDPVVEARVATLLSEMTVEQKVGQIIQADIGSVTPEDIRKYRLGTILNGGSSGPYGDDRSPPEDWVRAADEYWLASMDPDGVGTPIPIIWGIDAVHGHSNVIGATIFPHNIGLGAANDAALIEQIGAATAREIAVTGLDWTFAPTLAVARDDRWGRTYESYSEDPKIVGAYGGAMVRGLQGVPGTDDFLGPNRVIATAKHFVADGGTSNGKDQGDTRISETELRDVHTAGYLSAIEAGVQSVMASFSSWNGVKMHGNRGLLQDVLFDRLGFDGLVVGDWNAHGKLDGCTNEDCPDAFKAGIDVYMAPDSWKPLYDSTLAAVQSGEISTERLDEGVARILRVKIRAGIFERGRPSSRALAGKIDELGSEAHREIARDAVRKSLVLLKNNEQILPISRTSSILVVGSAANDLSQQTGGWTISWQGLDTTHADFPDAQTILEGIVEGAGRAGGQVAYSNDGSYLTKPDVAIVVYGEKPYAEFKGDLTDLEFRSEDGQHLDALRKLKAAGIPVVSVFLSGRPLWVNREINASDAFVAAWLPGTEGGGVADVLYDASASGVAYDFTGRLSFSWPRASDQVDLNWGDADYDPLFAYGYGMTKTALTKLDQLDESVASSGPSISADIFSAGRAVAPWSVVSRLDEAAVSRANFDRFAQEDAVRVVWNKPGDLAFEGAASDMNHLAMPDAGYVLSVRVDTAPVGPVLVTAESAGRAAASVDISDALNGLPLGEWAQISVPLKCISSDPADWEDVTAPLVITAEPPLVLSLSEVTVSGLPEQDQTCAPESE